MAAPAVATTATDLSTSLGTNNAHTLPTGSTTGDLILVLVVHDSTTMPTASTGWTALTAGETNGGYTARWFARVLDGSGSDTLTVSGGAQDHISGMLRITGHGVTNAGLPGAIWFATPVNTGTATTTPDPPAANISSARDWLIVTATTFETTATGSSVSAAPTNYTTNAMVGTSYRSANSTTAVALGIGFRQLSASSAENPGTFTSTSRPYIAYTLAISPPFTSSLAGSITPAGAGPKAITVLKTASITPTGPSGAIYSWQGRVAGSSTGAGSATTNKIPGGGGTAYTSTLTGSITASGTKAGTTAKPLAGSSTSTGTKAGRPATTKAGGITASGAKAGQANKRFTGSSTGAGAKVGLPTITKTGSITTSGTKAGSAAKPLTGSTTSSGTTATLRVRLASIAGSITSAGAKTALLTKALTGSSSSSGVKAGRAAKTLTGSTTAIGVKAGRAAKALAGSSTSTGTKIGTAIKVLAGSITGTGAKAGRAAKPLAGSVTSAGAPTTNKIPGGGGTPTYTLSLGGSLTPLGPDGAVRSYLGRVTGSSTPSGIAARGAFTLTLTGSLTPTGPSGITLEYAVTFVGSATPSAGITASSSRLRAESHAGSITPSGATSSVYTPGSGGIQHVLALGGSITPTGPIGERRTYVASATASTTPSGTTMLVGRLRFLTLTGSLTPTGPSGITRAYDITFAGSAAPSSLVDRTYLTGGGSFHQATLTGSCSASSAAPRRTLTRYCTGRVSAVGTTSNDAPSLPTLDISGGRIVRPGIGVRRRILAGRSLIATTRLTSRVLRSDRVTRTYSDPR